MQQNADNKKSEQADSGATLIALQAPGRPTETTTKIAKPAAANAASSVTGSRFLCKLSHGAMASPWLYRGPR